MTTSYIWVTAATMLIFLALDTVFLTAEIGYTLFHPAHFPPLTTYPLQGALVMFLVIVLIIPLIGGLFGTLTTRRIVYRVRKLVTATTQIANGQYTQRVIVTRNDEIGQLEYQFNRMAEQLEESIEQREMLAEQNARFAERTRISRELQDSISLDLFSLRMMANGLQAALPADSPFQPQITTLEQTTTNITRELHALLLEMRPLQLENQGLAKALEELSSMYRTRLGLTVTTTITPCSLTPQAEHTLLRIAQEAMTNAIRHGHATQITLDLHPRPQAIVLTITDDGQGFELARQGTTQGFGLRLMQERIQEMLGSFEVKTVPGCGTRISVCLPMEESDDSSRHSG